MPSEFILRRDPASSLLETSREQEFVTLKLLESQPSVLSPRARWLDAEGKFFGRPAVILDRVTDGSCDWFVFNNESVPLRERMDLARRYIHLLGRVHSTDWRLLGFADVMPMSGEDPAEAQLQYWRRIRRAHQREAYPEIDYIEHWLRSHPPKCEDPVLVHGDFKPGNLLISGTNITALLDWELAHIGDRHEDLGWITNPIRRREHQITGHWERAEIVRQYELVTHQKVDEFSISYWNVFANYKLAAITLTGLDALAQGKAYPVYWGIEEFVGLGLDIIKDLDATVS